MQGPAEEAPIARRGAGRRFVGIPGLFASALLLLFASGGALAAEIDSVTGRADELAEASGRLDALLGEWLREGVEEANRSGETCDEAALYRSIRRAIARPFIGHLVAEQLNEDEGLDRRRIRLADSIYRDVGFFEAISVHWKDLSAVVRVGDAVVGVDKLGHFLVEGWRYFEIAELEGEGVSAAMSWGEQTERRWFGHYTTGVYSYADLVADFEGLRFWSRVLGRGPDPLGESRLLHRAYVGCSRRWWVGARRWRVARPVRVERYVSAAWDEAVNCSAYRSAENEARIRTRIAEHGAEAGVDYTCPIDADACARARERYGVFAERLLHPACLAAERTRRPWWRVW